MKALALSVILFLLFAETLVGQAPAPKATKAKLGRGGGLEVQFLVYKPVLQEREIVRDGKRRVVPFTVLVPEFQTRIIAKSAYSIFDDKARKLGPMEIGEKLKNQVDVLAWESKKPPTAEQLKKVGVNQYVLLIHRTASKRILAK